MRVSQIGFYYNSLTKVLEEAEKSAIVQMVSSVKLQSLVNSSNSLVLILLNSKREPTILPIIAPIIVVLFMYKGKKII